MPYVTNCPSCGQAVASQKHMEIQGKPWPLFHCPRCTQRTGMNQQFRAKPLAFVVDPQGQVRLLKDVLSAQDAGQGES